LHKIKFQWKRCLLLFTALVLMVTLVAGCGAEEEKPTIKFADRQWESMWLENAIAQFIIEEGYGYPTEAIQMTTATMQVAIVKGDVDVDIEAWQQNVIDWYNEHIAAGDIEELGFVLEGGPQFWCIPQWVHEEHNIDTVEDMKDHWDLFKDPEDPSKGLFINSITGWKCTEINDVKIEAYGLTEYYNVIEPGSAGAETAALAGPQKKSEPVFGYYWAPTALMGMFDWYILEEPEYDPEIGAKILAATEDPSLRPLDEACAYESVPLAIMANKELRGKAPDVVAMLEKFTVGLDRCNKALAWAEENEVQDWEKAAVWFLREYDRVWKTWVTTDAYNKIKEAVDAYGSIP
jgi:glycine betaine/proline transport system substrate-binding protein